MNINNDFQKYLKSKKINSEIISIYNKNNSQFLDDGLMFPHDVFNRLLKERIIILSGEIDTHLCELVKANLLYIE